MSNTKICSHCQTRKPLDEFHHNKRFPCGRTAYCKTCKRVADLAYKQKNRKCLSQRQSEYYRKNIAHYKAYFTEHYQKHRDANRAARRIHYAQHKERWKVYGARRVRSPLMRRLDEQIRRARLARVGGKVTKAEWLAMLERYGHKCLKCGSTERLTMDHVLPISRGGPNTIDNIQPLCLSCNSSKFDKHIDYRPSHSSAS